MSKKNTLRKQFPALTWVHGDAHKIIRFNVATAIMG